MELDGGQHVRVDRGVPVLEGPIPEVAGGRAACVVDEGVGLGAGREHRRAPLGGRDVAGDGGHPRPGAGSGRGRHLLQAEPDLAREALDSQGVCRYISPPEVGEREVFAMRRTFRVSTGLKDLIGRDLITNDFVAVFELVKNSFDAHATTVRILFESDRIVITDDGKGMSEADIFEKWLFVAYSAKREGTEDGPDYRDGISRRGRAYAGAKGVGRFSCDRLGSRLQLSSRSPGGSVQIMDIDWTLYEQDAREEFGDIEVDFVPSSSISRSQGSARNRVRNCSRHQ